MVTSDCPEYKIGRENKLVVLLKSGMTDEALSELDILSSLSSENYSYFFIKGSILEQKGDTLETQGNFVEGINKVKEKYEEDPSLENRLGYLYSELYVKPKSEVLNELDKLLKENQKDKHAQSLINFTKSAIKEFRRDRLLPASPSI